ncbi:SET domain-containing protein [Rubellicoccus peritrichatus]|uniref:SET domain-containing protein-lysine N-methyltransferase n=1 Tax=Rubellicoccus peritrichatus TaxID=3080537 RepID=A0AAQ3QVK3_9BACT|nr:SET domain-containing protein-lysine N-methyltransferase [Puniceicoccus sp. CR14]WOO40892.1 SET domain-containing protein-lysine N-methyltransferase [Puniceicoccus sp. CR14]
MAKKLWKLRKSKIHGNGLYAATDIESGAAIIEYVGEKIKKKESLKRCTEWEASARKTGEGLVYIFDLNEKYDLDGNIPNNPAKYINHSCDENCEAINEDDNIWIYASRDIKKGDELFFDYGYALEHFIDHPCLCGSENCVGYIVAKSRRKKLLSILKKQAAKKAAKKKSKAAKKGSKKATRKKKSTKRASKKVK